MTNKSGGGRFEMERHNRDDWVVHKQAKVKKQEIDGHLAVSMDASRGRANFVAGSLCLLSRTLVNAKPVIVRASRSRSSWNRLCFREPSTTASSQASLLPDQSCALDQLTWLLSLHSHPAFHKLLLYRQKMHGQASKRVEDRICKTPNWYS